MAAKALARCLLSAAAVRVAAVSTRYAASSFGPRTAQVDDRPPPSLTEATDQAHGPPGALDAFGDLADAPRLTISNITRRHRLVHDATGDLAADAASGATLFDTITQLAKSADARAQKTKQAVVEAAVEIARKPVEVLRVGVPVIAARAREATDAFSQGMGESIQLLEEGDVAGALKAATIAIARLQKASHISDEGTSAAVSRSVGFLMVFVLLGLAWGLEFLLSRKSVPEQEADPAEKGNMRQKPFFHALSFTRYMFCWLAVANNFYNPGRQTSSEAGTFTVFARWGCLAYPWFFVVSGFCNSFAKMVGPKPAEPEDWFLAMVQRVSTWYPFYVLVLTACAASSWTITAEDWSHYLSKVLLINGVIWSDTSFPNSVVSRWLSYLMVYLLAWSPMQEVIHSCKNAVLWTLFTIACLAAVPSAMMEWYFFPDAPFWVMLQYWPSFVFGQALAAWFVRNCMNRVPSSGTAPALVMKPVHDIPFWVRCGPTLAFAVLGTFAFCFSPYDRLPLLGKPVTPLLLKGGLIPLMGVMVAGLACQVDPVAKLLARAPFRWAEKLCLMTFLLQAPVHNAIRHWTGWNGLTWTFSTSLLMASILGHTFLEQPWRAALRLPEK